MDNQKIHIYSAWLKGRKLFFLLYAAYNYK